LAAQTALSRQALRDILIPFDLLFFGLHLGLLESSPIDQGFIKPEEVLGTPTHRTNINSKGTIPDPVSNLQEQIDDDDTTYRYDVPV
jgi:hypothetical protein